MNIEVITYLNIYMGNRMIGGHPPFSPLVNPPLIFFHVGTHIMTLSGHSLGLANLQESNLTEIPGYTREYPSLSTNSRESINTVY